jgi:hypothetical protein
VEHSKGSLGRKHNYQPESPALTGEPLEIVKLEAMAQGVELGDKDSDGTSGP